MSAGVANSAAGGHIADACRADELSTARFSIILMIHVGIKAFKHEKRCVSFSVRCGRKLGRNGAAPKITALRPICGVR